MLLAVVLIACFIVPFCLWHKAFSRRDWGIAIALAFALSLFLAYVSIISIWTPRFSNTDLDSNEGISDGHSVWSRLSYPLRLKVYHTPYDRLLFDPPSPSGNVSFNIIIVEAKASEINGTFYVSRFPTTLPLEYSLDFPLFTNMYGFLIKEQFFTFLVMLFMLFNVVGALVGAFMTYTLVNILSARMS